MTAAPFPCRLCGSPVTVHKADEGTTSYQPVVADPLHLLAEHRALVVAYKERTAELMRVMAERDQLLAEKGIVHRGSEAT